MSSVRSRVTCSWTESRLIISFSQWNLVGRFWPSVRLGLRLGNNWLLSGSLLVYLNQHTTPVFVRHPPFLNVIDTDISLPDRIMVHQRRAWQTIKHLPSCHSSRYSPLWCSPRWCSNYTPWEIRYARMALDLYHWCRHLLTYRNRCLLLYSRSSKRNQARMDL